MEGHATLNDLPAGVREKMCVLLNARLADCTDLVTQIKTAHWNVKGPQFIGLHKLFDEIYEAVAGHVDLIAERCVQLGGTAMGTLRIAAGQSQLEEYPCDIVTCEDHVREVSGRLSEFGRLMRKSIEDAQGAGDQDTTDICIEISRDIDKWLWFVEAHKQAAK